MLHIQVKNHPKVKKLFSLVDVYNTRTYPWTRIVEVFYILGCCGNIVSVPKAPCVSYSRIPYFRHACPKLNRVLISRSTGKKTNTKF